MNCITSKRCRFTAGLLAAIMALTLLAAALPAASYAASEGDFDYSVHSGEVTIDAYTGGGGAVTIPATLGGYPVTTIGWRAFANCTGITAVTIPEGVKALDGYAFYDCTGLRSVTLPDSVTEIGDCAFGHCADMDWIKLSNKLTSIGICAFSFCSDLDWIVIPDSVTQVGNYAFQDCYALTEVIIGNGLKQISTGMFYNCNSLGTVTLGNSVTSIGDQAFYACDVRYITAPATIKYIGDSAFMGCINLQDVYYAGTLANGEAIDFGPNNDHLLGTNIHFAHVHDFSQCTPRVTPSTCLQGGYIVYTCVHGEEYGMVQLPVDHKLICTPEIPATCTQPGMTAGQECAWCGLVAKESQPIEPKGHTMQDGICVVCSADFTGDGVLTDADAIYLLRHTLFSDVYPIQGLGDVNGDEEITDADAIYLLRHTLFPNIYPLYPKN